MSYVLDESGYNGPRHRKHNEDDWLDEELYLEEMEEEERLLEEEQRLLEEEEQAKADEYYYEHEEIQEELGSDDYFDDY